MTGSGASFIGRVNPPLQTAAEVGGGAGGNGPLSYLRDKLDNRSLMVEGTFEESGNTKKIPYTTKEKFDYWAAQNPDLLKLKEKLGLDTDF
jgi:DNA polymerase-3 subunit gamma/tau